MAVLQIDLQEGFQKDTVTVAVHGEEVFKASDVTTRYQIGRAASLTVDLAAGAISVTIDVPGRRLSETVRFLISKDHWLGVSVTSQNKIVFLISDEPFRYL